MPTVLSSSNLSVIDLVYATSHASMASQLYIVLLGKGIMVSKVLQRPTRVYRSSLRQRRKLLSTSSMNQQNVASLSHMSRSKTSQMPSCRVGWELIQPRPLGEVGPGGFLIATVMFCKPTGASHWIHSERVA